MSKAKAVSAPVALCLGGAATVWADVAAAQLLLGEAAHLIVACNYAGIRWPGRLDAWCTLHPEQLEGWRAERARAVPPRNADYRVFGGDVDDDAGSSGLFMARKTLAEMSVPGLILCGVPMDDTGGHIRHPGDWTAAAHYRAAFEAAKAEGLNIRSMSGWTAELFGRPDAAWLGALGVTASPAREADSWVAFVDAFDWDPTPRTTVAYPAGFVGRVPRACRALAMAAGAAVKVPAPAKGQG